MDAGLQKRGEKEDPTSILLDAGAKSSYGGKRWT